MPVYHKRSRYPRLIEKGKCRGCGDPVPKGRLTWCSNACYAKYEPICVRSAVWQRDNGICQSCGTDIKAAIDDWENRRDYKRTRPTWECDHIVPFSEGGVTVLENMRTLCVDCHKKRTAEWRKRRAEQKLSRAQCELSFA